MNLRRRTFIAGLGAAATWPIAAWEQQSAKPVIGFINGGSPEGMARPAAAFRSALQEAGYVEGQNVAVEYHWLEGNYDRVSALVADLIRRGVAVIAIPGATPATIAAKAATATIPIVFGLGDDPVKLGLVASLARPGGNVTGTNFLFVESVAKRLGLLHDLVPNASRVAVLINPSNAANTESILRDVPEAARAVGLQIQVLKAGTKSEIDEAFAVAGRERADALFLASDAFFTSRRGQFATLAARDRMPTSCGNREMAEAGLLMSYGASLSDMFRQVGLYTGKILKGTKPAELPILQASKFEFVINLQTARALGIEVPNAIQLLADDLIE